MTLMGGNIELSIPKLIPADLNGSCRAGADLLTISSWRSAKCPDSTVE